MLSTWEQMLGRWKRGFSDGFYVALVVASWKDGEGNGNPLQYSCLENAVDRGAWWAAVHGVTKSRTRLSNFTFTFHFHALEKEMATHSSTLAWKIPWMEEPGGLQSMGSLRVGHDWATSLSRIGEGNGTPLQYSCLENLRDGRAWWAAICEVAQSRTRLKQLSSKMIVWFRWVRQQIMNK